jgi:hypothetical protein
VLSTYTNQATSECDIQVALCMALAEKGFQWKTEVKLTSNFSRGCRFDVVVYKDDNPIAVVEVKKNVKRTGQEPSKLGYYRKMSGLPVLLCAGKKGIEEVLGGLL